MKINPVLVEVYRGDILESFHRGVVCVVNDCGEIVFSAGNVKQVCYPRSALKYFQQIPLIESGAFDYYGFTMQELAVMCGSHSGEQKHVDAVEGILNRIGLDQNYLKCGVQTPAEHSDASSGYTESRKPAAIYNNCSGKHAGFLAYTKYINADLKTYHLPDQPLQEHIIAVVSDMYEYPRDKLSVAIDGCSAPNFAMPVYNQALAYKNLVNPAQFGEKRQSACQRVVEAVSKNPFMVAGSGRYCTDLMTVCGDELVGKAGAEGVFAIGLKHHNIGCSIKIDDGKTLPQYNVAQLFVEQTGLFKSDTMKCLQHYKSRKLQNFAGEITGEIKLSEMFIERFEKIGSLLLGR